MKNRIFTSQRPDMSDVDIDKFKDFDGVLDKLGQLPPENPGTNNSPKFDFKQFLKYSKNIFIIGGGISAAIFGIQWFSGGEKGESDKDEVVLEEVIVVDTPAVRPPVKGLETPFDTYTIDAGKTETIVTPLGTEITIEENTFLDSSGTIIQGEVDVQFREYHNVIDIFTSGIPMEYDSAGVSYTFESAGMFEIQVKQKNVELNNYSKDIVVDIVSDNTSSKFNDYYFDEEVEKWKFLEKSSLIDKNKRKPEMQETKSSKVAKRDLPSDETVDTEMSELYPSASNSLVQETSISQILPQAPTAPKSPVYPPILSAKYAFEVKFDKTKFPEIHERAVFQVDESQSAFSPAYYKIKWDVLSLGRAQNEEMYNLHLEKGDKKMDIQCFPAISKEEYNRIKSEYEAANKAYNDSLQVWNRYLASQRPAVKNWGTPEDHMISSAEKKMMDQVTTRRVKVRRSGIYNCDHPMYAQKYMGDRVMATFYADSTNVTSLRNYVVERNRNALFAARNGGELYLDKDKELIVWVWTLDHKIGIIRADQLKNYASRESFSVVLYKASDGLRQLKKMLES